MWIHWLLLSLAVHGTAVLTAGNFSQGELDDWQEKRFNGATRYRLTETDHGRVLCANSNNSASARYRRLPVDLDQTPYLHWSWRVDRLPDGGDETSRAGDDHAARVFVVKWGGLLFWRTRALVYVWSGNRAPGSQWPSPYSPRLRVIVVRSGSRESGRWLAESRDVAADFRHAFGEQITQIDGVALMTDSDNRGGRASACYGDIYFSGSG